MLHGAAKAEPRSKRNVARRLWRQGANIERDQSEASAFKEKIRSTQELFQALLRRTFSAAHPPQPLQPDPCGGGRPRIAGITRTHNHAPFSAPGGRGRR